MKLIGRLRAVDRITVLAVGLPTIVGFIVALWNLGGKPLWYDETFEALLVMHPAKKFAYWVATFETTGAFYHSVLWVWKFAGFDEFMLRLPSAISAVATIPVTFFIGRRFLNERWAGVAGVLLAVSSLWLSHAQEARPYAVFLLTSGLSTLALLRATEQPSRARWAVYAVATLLAVWSHLMMVFVVLAQAIAMVAHPRVQTWWRPAMASLGLAVLGAVPIAYSISRANQSRWDWLPTATPQALWEGFRHLASDPGFLVTDLWLVLWAGGIVIGLRRYWKDREIGWPTVLVAVSSMLAVLGPWLGAQFKDMYAPRYVFEALPPMILLSTLTMSVLRPRIVGAAVAILLFAIGVNNVYFFHTTLGWPDFRSAVKVVVDEGGPSDALAYFYLGPFEVGARYELRYYLKITPGSDDIPTMILLPDTAEPLEQRVRAALAGYQRLFLIGRRDHMNDADTLLALSEIERSFDLAHDYGVFGLDVRLYTRTSP